MKLSFITTSLNTDISNWSGTVHYVSKTLEDHFDVNYIMGLKSSYYTLASFRKLYYGKLKGKRYSIYRTPEMCKLYASQVSKKIGKDVDVVFSDSTLPIAYLKTTKPIVLYTDAVFSSFMDYYLPSDICSSKNIEEGMIVEKRALDNASLILFSSDWAAQSAINDFGIDPEKVKVVPFGANIDFKFTEDEIKKAIKSRSKDVCKITFIGVDWVRKGGQVVFDTVKKLNSMGLPAEMHILGLRNLPEEVKNASFVIDHGFVNKSTTSGNDLFREILLSSHFMFVPSVAEAYGIVFCEASAYGIPSISTQSGGIPTVIRDGINGKTFPLGTDIDIFADYIYSIFNDRELYEQLAESSFDEYNKRLNWKVAGDTITAYINSLF